MCLFRCLLIQLVFLMLLDHLEYFRLASVWFNDHEMQFGEVETKVATL
jgi:hypothetical protein